MDKIEKLIPKKIEVLGHKVIVTPSVFDGVVKIVNAQTNTINALIDCVDELTRHMKSSDANTVKLRKSVKQLAKAIQVYIEEDK